MPESDPSRALDREAEEIARVYNQATKDYAPELSWEGMHHDMETGQAGYVFEATDYVAREGLEALREMGKEVAYIEANAYVDMSYERDGVYVSIEIPVSQEIQEETYEQ